MPMQSPSKLSPSKPLPTPADHQAKLEEYLRVLKLPMFLHHYQTYAQDAARSGLSFERFLLALCEAETADREAKRAKQAISRAKFPFVKELSTYDFTLVEDIPKQTVLELAQGDYIARQENLMFLGNPGLGKTHLAIGLALEACRQGRSVRFYKAAALVNDLQLAQHNL